MRDGFDLCQDHKNLGSKPVSPGRLFALLNKTEMVNLSLFPISTGRIVDIRRWESTIIRYFERNGHTHFVLSLDHCDPSSAAK
jgi:hypothetical protein